MWPPFSDIDIGCKPWSKKDMCFQMSIDSIQTHISTQIDTKALRWKLANLDACQLCLKKAPLSLQENNCECQQHWQLELKNRIEFFLKFSR
jgi:hypothetical protein